MDVSFEDLTRATHDAVRTLILEGLGEHWGYIDESLNPDLDDMFTAYADGRTIVARSQDGSVIGTGTLKPVDGSTAQMVRMSVDGRARRLQVGRQVVDELVATARAWGCDRVIVETTTEWTGVVEFYLRCGFEITHVEELEFGEGTWFQKELT